MKFCKDLHWSIPSAEGPRNITLSPLKEVFRDVLSKDSVDLSWPPERQLNAFLDNEAAFIAATQHDKYAAVHLAAAVMALK